jgi:alkylation response protein AidB-like acyl-CoA dehydrogenase
MTGDELDIKICRLLTLSFISSAAKCFASDVAMEVTTNAVQLFGGAGYTVDFPVERMMRDAKITQIYEAPIRFSASSWALLA